jgi:hypothetical protein
MLLQLLILERSSGGDVSNVDDDAFGDDALETFCFFLLYFLLGSGLEMSIFFLFRNSTMMQLNY